MEKLRFTSLQIIRESGSKSGREFDIVIIREGKSKNGRYYSKDLLEKSIGIFEGAKIAAYEWKNFHDHLSENTKQMVPAGFPSSIAGLVTGVTLSKLDDGKYGLVGRMKLHESAQALADVFMLGLQTNNKNVLGFSIDVYGACEKRTVEGEELDYITEISEVNEITVVTNPAAGGQLLRLVASFDEQKEKSKMKDQLLRLIAALNYKKLSGVSFTESDQASLAKVAKETVDEVISAVKENADVVAALKAAKAAIDAGDAAKAQAAIDSAITMYEQYTASAQSAAMEAAKQTAAQEAEAKIKKDDKGGADVVDLKEAQKKLNERLNESEVKICESNLKSALVESKLPEPSKDRIKEKFSGKVFKDEDLKKEIDSETKYVSRMAESLHPRGLTIEVGQDSTDKLGDAVEGMIAGKSINKVTPFKSLTEAYCKMENVSPFAAGLKEKVWMSLKDGAQSYTRKTALKEAITISGLGEVLGDRLHKTMVKEYAENGLDDWKKIVTITERSDFLTNRATRLGGYGTNIPTVNEGAAYTSLTSPTDEEATYTLAKKGGLETLSWESILSDNIKGLQLIPKRLARGAKNTLYQFVFELINPATNAAIYDTVTLYHATHGANLRTAALSWTEFDAIKLVMNDQTAYNEANFFVMNNPKYIVVPNELWRTAMEIVNSTVTAQGARTETVDNSYASMGLEVIQVPYWTDSNNFCVVADPATSPGIEIGFLNGNQEPEILQEVAGTGSDFTNDQIRYKLRHVYGGAVTDFRPFVGNVVP